MTDILPAIVSAAPRAELTAPTQRELMAELGVRPRSRLLARLPGWAQLFVTNKKGMVGLAILAIFVILALLAPLITPYDPYRRAGKPHVQPGVEHFLGTSRQGKDNFSQLLEGSRASLTVGFIAGFSATLIGLAVGISAGYFGGKTDEVLTFFVNVSLVLPALPRQLHRGGVADRNRPRACLDRLGLERAHHPHPDPGAQKPRVRARRRTDGREEMADHRA